MYQYLTPFYCWVVYLVWMNHNLFSHYLVKGIWVIYSLRLLRIMLFWTCIYSFLCEYKSLLLWDKCSGMLLLGHMFSFIRDCQTVSQRSSTIHIPPSQHERFSCSATSPAPGIVSFFSLCLFIIVYFSFLIKILICHGKTLWF